MDSRRSEGTLAPPHRSESPETRSTTPYRAERTLGTSNNCALVSAAIRPFEFDHTQGVPRTLEVDRDAAGTERQLESWLHANPDVILNEPLLIVGRQYGLDTGIPDLLALDQWGNVVVVELKRGQSGSGSAIEETILSQPQNYAQSLSGYEDLADIYREYRTGVRDGEWDVGESAAVEETLETAHETALGGADESEFNAHQRMVVLAEEITPRTENNARHLLEQGLAVQCVAVQRFRTRDEREFLVTSTVVDYPLSRVQPADGTVDYSDLLLDVRDRISPEIAELCRFEGPDDVHRSGSRQLGFNSDPPTIPTPRPPRPGAVPFHASTRRTGAGRREHRSLGLRRGGEGPCPRGRRRVRRRAGGVRHL